MAQTDDMTRLRRQQRTAAGHAEWYRYLAEMITAGRLAEVTHWPQWVTRSQSAAWYLSAADRLEQRSVHAGDVANALSDLQHMAGLQRYSPAQAQTYLLSELQYLRVWCDRLAHDAVVLAPKLTTPQREALVWEIVQLIRPVVDGLGVDV